MNILWASVLWLFLTVSAAAAAEIPYSGFKQELMTGHVREVVIGRHAIQGTRLNGETFETNRVEDPSLIPLLDSQGVRYTGAKEGGWGELVWLVMLPLGVLLLAWGLFAARGSSAGNGGVMTFNKSKARLYQGTQSVTFQDVAGVPEAKEELAEVVAYLKEPERFRAIGGRVPRGVLLVGPPGTGKTLLARALAGEAGVPFFSISGSDFVELFVGVGAARVRDLFQQAQDKAPCIVFIDELDALGKARGTNPMGINDEREQALNQLLSELDGFERQAEVIVVAATNRPETLDPALLRPGRFDRQVVVDRPDLEGRLAILRVHARRIRLHPAVDLRGLAVRTPGMVGADLANLLNEGALLAARRGKSMVDRDDLEEAADRVVAGLARKGRVLSDEEKRVVSVHEIGHALVATLLPHTDPVHKVTVIPRGVAGLGFTLQHPEEERFLMRRSDLLNRLCVLMGGRAAEEVVLGEVTTGAHQDLVQATQLALAMVRDHGMGTRVGLVTFTQEEGLFVGGRGWSREHSDATAQLIDEEVKQLLDWAYDHTKQILSQHRGQLLRLSHQLFERETLSGDEIRALVHPRREAA